MFGNNSQDNSQNDNTVVNDYNSDLPVGGEDLLTSGAMPSDNPITPTDMPQQMPATPYDNSPMSSSPMDSMGQQNTSLPANDDDLAGIKQDALQELKPLVGQLDQTPEEKFRTTMMMIQASDDKSLLKSAHAQAQQISNEKVRAQALLDVVNEINYFTQQDAQ